MLLSSCKKESDPPAPVAQEPVPVEDPVPPSDFVEDVDGNVYPVVRIGEQYWMGENLRTGRYRDGTEIPHVVDDTLWSELTSPAWSGWMNDPDNDTIPGRYYNWYAADHPGLCPAGWRLPTDGDWAELEVSLGLPEERANGAGSRGHAENVGGKMKAVDAWPPLSTGATNESGFTALPEGGRLGEDGRFAGEGSMALWWSASESGAATSWLRELKSYNHGVVRGYAEKRNGFSVRCVWGNTGHVEGIILPEEGLAPLDNELRRSW